MREVLIANSISHLEEGNGRIAIIEAVIALEATARQVAPTAITRLPGASSLNQDHLDKLIEHMGLSAFVNIGLGTIKGLAGINETDIEVVAEAIKKRNNIIHNAERDVSVSDAQRCVSAIKRVIDTLEQWARR